jgi:replicative DNA helicase
MTDRARPATPDAPSELPNQAMLQIAKRDEPRFNSLFLKHADLLGEAVRSGITYEWFSVKDQQILYRLIASYFNRYKALLSMQNLKSVAMQSFPKQPDAETYWLEVYARTFSETAVPDDYQFLRKGLLDRYMQRRVYGMTCQFHQELLQAVRGQTELIQKFKIDLARIEVPGQIDAVQVFSMRDELPETWKEIQDRREHPDRYHGIPCGFKCLDSVYWGFPKGKYLIFLGAIGGGKTTVMSNFARNMAAAGKKVVYVTVESTARYCSTRLLAAQSEVDSNRIKEGGKGESGLIEPIMSQLERGKRELESNGVADNLFWIQALYRTPWSEIEQKINGIRAFTPVDVVFVDYLNVIGRETTHQGRPDLELHDVSYRVQNYGKQHGILMMTAQQFRAEKMRELHKVASTKANEFRVGAGDMSGSKELAADADFVLALWIDPLDRRRMKIWSTKAREGRSAEMYELHYDPNSGRLKDEFSFRDHRFVFSEAQNRGLIDEVLQEQQQQSRSPFAETEGPDGRAPI